MDEGGHPLASNKRLRLSQPDCTDALSGSDTAELEEESTTPENRALAAIDLNRYLKSSRLHQDRGLDTERQEILESAIKRAKQAMREPGLHMSPDDRVNIYDPSMYPSVEFLYMLSQGR